MSMNRPSFAAMSLGRKVALGSAALMFISYLLPWLGVDFGFGVGYTINGFYRATAWLAFFLLLAVLALLVLPFAGISVRESLPAQYRYPDGLITLGLGAAAVVLLIIYALSNTGDGVGLRLGYFLGFLSALGIAAGGWLMMQSGE